MAQVPFVDDRVSSLDVFAALKPTLPFRKIPVLEGDGQIFAESQSILRYAGHLAKMYPVNDPMVAAKVDEITAALKR